MIEKLISCPQCRGYGLEKQWCDLCNGKGMIKDGKTPSEQETDYPRQMQAQVACLRERAYRPRIPDLLNEIDILRAQLTAERERTGVLVDLLRRAAACITDMGWNELERDIWAAIRPPAELGNTPEAQPVTPEAAPGAPEWPHPDGFAGGLL